MKKLEIQVKAIPGDFVKVYELDQTCMIRCVSVQRNNQLTYQIEYFANGDQKSCWLYDDQFGLIE